MATQHNLFEEPPYKPRTVAVHVREGCDRYCGRSFREWKEPSEKNPLPGQFGNPFREGGARHQELMLWLLEQPGIPKEVYNVFLLMLLDEEWTQEFFRADPIRAFEMYLEIRVDVDPEWRDALLELYGLRLGCWCKPHRCHVDVIVRWVEAHHAH